MNSFRTMRVPSRSPDDEASFQGTPMTRASGAKA